MSANLDKIRQLFQGDLTANTPEILALIAAELDLNETAAEVPSGRLINTTSPLTGGGNLTADRTLGITVPIVTESSASHTFAESDRGAEIRCTAAGGCTLSGLNTMAVGFYCYVRQSAAGAAVIDNDGAATTLNLPADCSAPPTTSEQGAVIGLVVVSAGVVDVFGSLALTSALATQAYANTGDAATLASARAAVMANPPTASTGDVTIDATVSPPTDYYMAPAGDQVFDYSAATVSQRVTITKTTTSTHKMTLPAKVGWTIFPDPGTSNTAKDLPGSATNASTAVHQWTLTIDVPNKIVYLSPPN